MDNSNLHHLILRHIIEDGYAPDLRSLAREARLTETEMAEALQRLAEYHGVVLHPHAPEVWVIHPFSTAPTNFLVKNARGEWWGNCAWCALGAAVLIGGDVTIRTALGAVGRQVELHIRVGELQESGYVIHFPVPMANAWDNVIYTCSLIQLFEDEAQVDAWCHQHGIVKGDVQTAQKVLQLSKAWYGRHLDKDWKKWTSAEAAQIFGRLGFSGPIWEVNPSGERF